MTSLRTNFFFVILSYFSFFLYLSIKYRDDKKKVPVHWQKQLSFYTQVYMLCTQDKLKNKGSNMWSFIQEWVKNPKHFSPVQWLLE